MQRLQRLGGSSIEPDVPPLGEDAAETLCPSENPRAIELRPLENRSAASAPAGRRNPEQTLSVTSPMEFLPIEFAKGME